MAKYDKDKMQTAFDAFMKNPHWKKMYEDAPSDECKEYLKFTFYYSKFYDPDADDADEFEELQAEVENKLSADDWEYLKGMAPNSPFVGYCNQRIKELSK